MSTSSPNPDSSRTAPIHISIPAFCSRAVTVTISPEGQVDIEVASPSNFRASPPVHLRSKKGPAKNPQPAQRPGKKPGNKPEKKSRTKSPFSPRPTDVRSISQRLDMALIDQSDDSHEGNPSTDQDIHKALDRQLIAYHQEHGCSCHGLN